MNDYSHIINKEEAKGFFDSIKYLYKIILRFASSDTKKRRKLEQKEVSEENKDNHFVPSGYESNTKLHELSPDSDHSAANINYRSSVLTTDRSLAENDPLDDKEEYNDTFNESGVLNITDTFEIDPNERSNEDKQLEREIRKERKKQIKREQFSAFDDRRDPTDYDVLNRFLLRVHKYLDKLDSAGRTFRQIFGLEEKYQFEAFRYFIINLEVYGSFVPLSDRLHDPQVTRISSYLKISKVRKGLEAMVNEFEETDGKVFKDVWLKTRMINYNFNKIEAFLARKHSQSSHKKVDDKKSFFIDYDIEHHPPEEEKKESPYDFESTFGDGTKNSTPRSGLSVVDDDEDEYHYVKTLFKDFTEPDVMRSGYLIPLTTRHGGMFSKKESSLLETHLRQSGFI